MFGYRGPGDSSIVIDSIDASRCCSQLYPPQDCSSILWVLPFIVELNLFVCVDIRSALHRLVGMLTISKFSTMLCSGWTHIIRCHFCSPVALPSACFHSFFLGCPLWYNFGFCSFSLGWVVGRLRWRWPPAQSLSVSCNFSFRHWLKTYCF